MGKLARETTAGREVLAATRGILSLCPAPGRILVAVSGGLDSMVLLEALVRVQKDLIGRLHVAHVNHGLRGAESLADEALVNARAQALGIPISVLTIDWGDEKPSQAGARSRREVFYRNLLAHPGDRVFLAHHLNDQAETIFFRLLRGTGVDGLRGMAPIQGFKVRPFLSLEKEQLREAAKSWGVVWREDGSNQNTRYERNWIRQLFPLLESRRPGVQKKLAALAEEVRLLPVSLPSSADCFSLGQGMQFFRFPAKNSGQQLKDLFQLPRQHVEALQRLLATSSGKLTAKERLFHWSCGVLMVTDASTPPIPRYEVSQKRLSTGTGYESVLGAWSIPESIKVFEGRGEVLKKHFQSLHVPLFFRKGIPVFSQGGRPCAILSANEAEISGNQAFYEPSALGHWWLTPSSMIDDPAACPSK